MFLADLEPCNWDLAITRERTGAEWGLLERAGWSRVQRISILAVWIQDIVDFIFKSLCLFFVICCMSR